ncbi:MAG: 2-hydroxyacyl-CoA dehydratase family protein [Candidatus Cloacimonetes bacterium]|nr:2-hydroxyacyl-CoA dehydratase family protein [Candidatus Cloacimonadota bacterium]
MSYHKMWAELGLNLEAHDQLLQVLSQGYQQLFLSQENRPTGMQYLDFVMSEIHGLRIQELVDAQKAGRKVVGSFCVFVPEELILAVDAISVGLCTGAEVGFDLAEQYLPRNTCALIKSSFGFKLGKMCPYIEASDLIVGENTCDGKKKSYEHLKYLVKDLYVMDLPQMKSEAGKALLKAEYLRFMKRLEELTGKTITVKNLKEAIEIVNAKRLSVARLARLRAASPAPISGLDSLLINQIFFNENPQRFTENINILCDELEARIEQGTGVAKPDAPRILVSGCPMAVPNWKLPAIVEQNGAVIVGEELCTGERGARWLTEIKGETLEELIDSLVERYWQIDCAVFTPNTDRLQSIKKMVQEYQADGVLQYNLQFCQPYTIESGLYETELEAAGIPVLNIETDYSQEDMGQLSTRIEAFIERLKQ